MKKVLVLALTLISITLFNRGTTNLILSDLKQDVVKEKEYKVTATMYFAEVSQCDKDPLITAGMFKIKPKQASQQKWIAVSRDLLERWQGEFKYGDFVKIEGAGHKDGIYKVVDTMNKRYKNRIDFLETAGTKPYKFRNVKLTKWNLSTQTESLLATL